MTTEQINKAAEEYVRTLASSKYDLSSLNIHLFTVGAKFALSHSSVEIEELKAEIEHMRKCSFNDVSEIRDLKAENEKLREALKMCLDYMDATSIKKGYMKINEIETARKLIEG